MADETPKPKVNLTFEQPSDTATAHEPVTDAAPGPEDKKAAGAGATWSLSGWVSRTFPGHEKAFWGGVTGLLVALLLFAIGFFRTLLIAVLVVAGVAVGQALDGDPKIVNLVRAFLSRNQ